MPSIPSSPSIPFDYEPEYDYPYLPSGKKRGYGFVDLKTIFKGSKEFRHRTHPVELIDVILDIELP